jgi:hypothetical protein
MLYDELNGADSDLHSVGTTTQNPRKYSATITGESQDGAVGIATRLRAGQYWVRILAGGNGLFSSPKCPDRLRSLSSLLFYGSQGTFPGSKVARAWSWPLTTVLSSRMSGDIPLFPLHAFIACTGTTLHFHNNRWPGQHSNTSVGRHLLGRSHDILPRLPPCNIMPVFYAQRQLLVLL